MRNFRNFLLLNILFLSAYLFADTSYTVKKGDTLFSISRKYQITVAELRAANNLSENDVLKAGEKLIIPSADISNAVVLSTKNTNTSSQSTAKPETSNSIKTKNYVVVKGDTLYGIARKFDIKLPELISLNKLEANATIKVGQKLLVPDTSIAKVEPKKEEPIKKDTKTEVKKDNKEDTYKTSNILWPLDNPNIKNIKGKVSGVILYGDKNENVKSVSAGTVMYTGIYRGFGEIIFVQSNSGLIYAYSGLGSVKVKKSDYVVVGEELGKTENNENASIKFMVFKNGQPIDPAKAPRL